MTDYDFSQTRSFNLGVAKDTSIEAALVYDELSFLSKITTRTDEWFFKSYEEMQERLPLSKYQLREAYKALQAKGYIDISLKKAYGAPTLHFRMLKNLTIQSKKTKQTMDSKKTEHSITATTTLIHQHGVEKAVEKKAKAPSLRGEPSPAKEKIRKALQSGGVKALAT